MNWTTLCFILFYFSSFLILVYWIDHFLHQKLTQMKKPAMKGQLSALLNLKSKSQPGKIVLVRKTVLVVYESSTWLLTFSVGCFTYSAAFSPIRNLNVGLFKSQIEKILTRSTSTPLLRLVHMWALLLERSVMSDHNSLIGWNMKWLKKTS